MGELRLPELGDRYNAAGTYVDANRVARPEKVAIRCQGASVTYGEMAGNVDRCGNALRGLGVDIEDRVVILCLDSPAFVYAFFGAIKLGAIPVPANTLLTARDLAYILRDSRAVAVVVSAP
ncbi:MAG TPA: AMP-binding protein, partial [Candidatus Limnocylindria bacterium]|nr:AMP-binding protein [Candidatus Limnocylindria bacterium]